MQSATGKKSADQGHNSRVTAAKNYYATETKEVPRICFFSSCCCTLVGKEKVPNFSIGRRGVFNLLVFVQAK